MSHTPKLLALCLLSAFATAQPITATIDVAINPDDVPPVLEDNVTLADQSALFETPTIPLYIPTIDKKFRPDDAPLRDAIKTTLENSPKALWVGGHEVKLRNPNRTQDFYLRQDYPLIWTQGLLNNALTELHTAVQSAADDALPVARYHADLIEAYYQNPNAFEANTAAVEIILTDAFLTLAGDLGNGLVEPTVTQPEWNTKDTALSDEQLSALLVEAANGSDIHQMLNSLNADNPRYQALKAAYKQAKGGVSVSKPVATPPLAAQALLTQTLRVGDRGAEVLLLREKLGLAADSDVFDAELERQVKKYQHEHKLQPVGNVGPKTLELLNGGQSATKSAKTAAPKPKALPADLLAINMERQRWLPQNLGDKYILVNIPSRKVKLYDNDKVTFEVWSAIGRKDRQTPAFVDAMRTLAFAPTWTVPPTILKDKREKGVSDAYDLIAPNGKIVKPSEFGGQIPQGYALRMPPNASNPLGRVKFLFPNKHSIYLHDTDPSGRKWGQAISSGCVRIDEPQKLAQLLLAGKASETTVSSYMKGIYPESSKNAGQPLKPNHGISINPVPIYLVYWTAWSNPEENNGVIHQPTPRPKNGEAFAKKFEKDVYGKDPELTKQYQSALAKYPQISAFTQESFAQTQSALPQ